MANLNEEAGAKKLPALTISEARLAKDAKPAVAYLIKKEALDLAEILGLTAYLEGAS